MGSLMIEENVVSAAGTVHHLTLDEMRSAISALNSTSCVTTTMAHPAIFHSRSNAARAALDS